MLRLLLILFFSFPLFSFAAQVAIIDTSYGVTSGGGGTSVTFAHDATGAEHIVVGIAIRDGGTTPSSVTFNGDALALLGSKQDGGDGVEETWVYSLENPDSGSYNVVVTLPATERFSAIAASLNNSVDLYGVNAFDGGNCGGATCDTTTATATQLLADDLMIGFAAIDTPISYISVLTGTQELEQNDTDAYVVNSFASRDCGATSCEIVWRRTTQTAGLNGVVFIVDSTVVASSETATATPDEIAAIETGSIISFTLILIFLTGIIIVLWIQKYFLP